ncbi:hypothetical protein GJV85_12710 [Sulfurimonas aquatica]|uniref:CoA ester lyase n=1 Tax=Sulfurimonas aquatica TaxID=2672570 RepID=A0A975B2B3_9BACT|nr:HpcH/HpaI aldolase/citrate lyase family protein [Sulfurimonas aquatica]QSZ42931.1 hypothetical protein GJV85_12710 [Sulfurimonas aquatica]
MKKVNYIDLGATLFVPSTHKNLEDILNAQKYPELKSVLIDTEDGIEDEKYEVALEKIQRVLRTYDKQKLLLFIRPKNCDGLRELLSLEGIEKVDGFILPKFSLSNAKEYLKILEKKKFFIMPSIEGSELFNQAELYELRDILLPYKEQILLVRFGLEDMLRQLRMKRSCEYSIFDYSAPASVLGTFIAIFKSAGFGVSGGVYPCFKDDAGFIRDVKRDLREGLFSKTIIHPKQIEITNELYKVTKEEYDEALYISKSDKALSAINRKMAEIKTMKPYSLEIIRRAELYGICDFKE